MRFFSTILAGAAIVAGVLAQKPTIDKYPANIKAGEPAEITYSPATATAKFVLRKGSPGNLATLETLTETATGGKYTWNVPKTLANAKDYALQIVVNGEDNYTGLIAVTGGEEESSSSASASATSGSASSTKSSYPTTSVTKSVSASITSSSVSGSITSSAAHNSTVTSATLSTARSSGSSSPSSATTTGSSPPESTGAASMLSSSPLALIFGAVAAMAYLN